MAAFAGIEQWKRRDWPFGIFERCVQQRDEMLCQPINSCCLKNVSVVLKHEAELVLRLTERYLQIDRRSFAVNAEHGELKARKRDLPFRQTWVLLHRTFRADVEILYLVERHAAHVTLHF